MDSVAALKQAVAAYLQNREGFGDAAVMTAHPAARRAYPLRGPVLAVGIDAVDAAPGGFGGYWGGGDTPLYGSGARITLRFDLYAPLQGGGDALHTLYEALCDHLLLRSTPFGFQKLWCGDIDYDAAAAANHLTARATLHSALLVGDDSVPITDFHLVHRNQREQEESMSNDTE